MTNFTLSQNFLDSDYSNLKAQDSKVDQNKSEIVQSLWAEQTEKMPRSRLHFNQSEAFLARNFARKKIQAI